MENALILFSGIMTAAAAAVVGVFLSLRKMVLVSDSLPHIALPGIALGVIFNFNPVWGALFFLFFAALIVWFIEYRTSQTVESIIGVLFVTALAAGAVLVPEEGILEAFFGDIEKLTAGQAVFQALFAVSVMVLAFYNFRPLLLTSVAPELARSLKMNVSAVEFLLLGLVALTVAVGINFMGVLLMSGLLIIPAVTARNLTKNLKQFFVLSVVFGAVFAAAGISLSSKLGVAAGILTVLIGAAFFVFSLFFPAKRR